MTNENIANENECKKKYSKNVRQNFQKTSKFKNENIIDTPDLYTKVDQCTTDKHKQRNRREYSRDLPLQKYPSPKLDDSLVSQNNITSNSNYSPTEKETKSSFLIQNVYEERVHIQPKRLKELFQTILRNKSHNSIRKLGYEIGISQDKHLNDKGSSMSLESFNKLQNLLDFDLKITIFKIEN